MGRQTSLVLGGLLLASTIATTTFTEVAHAEPKDPVVIGWWSYFDPVHYPTSTNPAFKVASNGDPNDFFYEPSGARGMKDTTLDPAVAWNTLISFILSKSSTAKLASNFTIDEASTVTVCFCEAQFGWALGLLYVPKDKYCDDYRLHVGNVDDGVELLVNGQIVGYKAISQNGDAAHAYLPLVDAKGKSILRPGINEVVVIHADDQQVQRYVHDVWIEHGGVQVPLAPTDIIYGRVVDGSTPPKPVYPATVSLRDAAGAVKDTFADGPLGFYFFAGLPEATFNLGATAAKFNEGKAPGTTLAGQAVRVDLKMTPGCSCPDGTTCGSSGECLPPCIRVGEFGKGCTDPTMTCVADVCVKNPCDTLTCAAGLHCAAGACVEDACTNVCCGAGETCSKGLCVKNDCPVGGCAAGTVCLFGACKDACDPTIVTCVGKLTCKAGKCADPCVVDPASCKPDAGPGFDGGLDFDSGGDFDATLPTDTGAPSDGGVTLGDADDNKSSGCGCTVPGSDEVPTGAIVVAGLALSAAAMRRRKKGAADAR